LFIALLDDDTNQCSPFIVLLTFSNSIGAVQQFAAGAAMTQSGRSAPLTHGHLNGGIRPILAHGERHWYRRQQRGPPLCGAALVPGQTISGSRICASHL
jgi:hypothetical protein